MPDHLHLTELGALTRAGQGYDQDAEAGVAEARSFQGRMELSQAGLRGRAGRQFTSLTAQHASNLALLGRQFAEQAYRVVKGEQAVVATDHQAAAALQAAASAVDTHASALRRPINAS
jgi:2-keto-3-deoxy-galactonokinase